MEDETIKAAPSETPQESRQREKQTARDLRRAGYFVSRRRDFCVGIMSRIQEDGDVLESPEASCVLTEQEDAEPRRTTGPLLRWGESQAIQVYREGPTGTLWIGGLVLLRDGWWLKTEEVAKVAIRTPATVLDTDDARRTWAERVLTAAIGARWER